MGATFAPTDTLAPMAPEPTQQVRIRKSLVGRAKAAAALEGVSLEQWLSTTIETALRQQSAGRSQYSRPSGPVDRVEVDASSWRPNPGLEVRNDPDWRPRRDAPDLQRERFEETP